MNVVTELFSGLRHWDSDPLLRRLQPKGLPVLHEDEGPKMGDSSLHTRTCDILYYGVKFHLAARPAYRVFRDLNVYYADDDPNAYVSPDIFFVKPKRSLPEEVTSYRLGRDGPPPRVVIEALSTRTYQEGDLTEKPVLYAALGIEEYILVDVTGTLLKERLLLLRRQDDGKWKAEQDGDDGVTSRFGFRVIIDTDGQVRVVNAKTGKSYARPDQAQQALEGREQAEARIRRLEQELARLRDRKRKKK